MHAYTLDHLSDATLLRRLSELVARDRANTAELLAHIAEVDARRLYADAGYSSMFVYCVRKLHLSEDAAGKRITAARAARRFPALLGALDLGRIHLTAACILAPHLTEANIETLIEAATHKGKAEIEAWLAGQSIMTPVTIRPCTIKPIVERRAEPRREAGLAFAFDSKETSEPDEPARPDGGYEEHAPERAQVSSDLSLQHAPERVDNPRTSAGVPVPEGGPAPALPRHYLMQLTIEKSTHDKLRRAQALLGHAVPSGNVAQVLDRALDLLLGHLERRKAGAPRPRKTAAHPTGKRCVPARVRRAVWERDEGRCTFVSASGHRCGERTRLEFDHIEPVARGGTATVEGIRLRCHAHNQLEAKRVFGAGFMDRKR